MNNSQKAPLKEKSKQPSMQSTVNPQQVEEKKKMLHEALNSVVVQNGVGKSDYETLFKKIIFDEMIPEEAMGISDGMMEFLYSQGYKMYQTGHIKHAAEIFKMLTTLNADETKHSIALGICYMAMEQWDLALQSLGIALVVDLKDPYPPMQMGECYLKLKNRSAALIMFNIAHERALKDTKYQFLIERLALFIDIQTKVMRDEVENKQTGEKIKS